MTTLADLLPRVRAIVDGATPGRWTIGRVHHACETYMASWQWVGRHERGPGECIDTAAAAMSPEDARYIALHDPEIATALWEVVEAADADFYERGGDTGSLLHEALTRLTTLLAEKLMKENEG